MSLTEGHPGNRSRRPDWRWLYAIALREIGLPSHAVAVDRTRRRLGENGVVDDWTVRVLRFLEAVNTAFAAELGRTTVEKPWTGRGSKVQQP
jgi:hypothetical protein